jgi:hypothetical protein
MKNKGNSKTTCPECREIFNIHENRSYKIQDSIIPGGWFIYAMNQFENFNKVTCPFCEKSYKSEEARLFGVFKSPYTIVILSLIFVGIVIGFLVFL